MAAPNARPANMLNERWRVVVERVLQSPRQARDADIGHALDRIPVLNDEFERMLRNDETLASENR